MIEPSEFGYERLGEIDDKAAEHFYYIKDMRKFAQYMEDVRNGQIFCFAVFKNNERIGSTLAEVTESNENKNLICLETGGEKGGYDFDKEYLAFYIAICKVLECTKFVVTASRPALEKMCERMKMTRTYSEYEMDINNEQL
jgi:hypothetical protein